MRCYGNIHEHKTKPGIGLRWWAGVFLVLVPVPLHAQSVIVEIGPVQVARALAAVVKDPAGDPLPNVEVEEFTSDWKQALRSAKTDANGTFSLTTVKGRDVYYLQLSLDGMDPLRVRVKVDHWRGKKLKLMMRVAT